MRKGLLCLGFVMSVLLIFCSFDLVEASSFREVKQVNETVVEVRSTLAENAKIAGTIKRGEFVTVFSYHDKWAYVQSRTLSGYVSTSALTTPKSTIKIASSKSGLVVKRVPTMQTNTLAVLKYGMVVEDFGSVGNGWSFVQYGNITGYVATPFMGLGATSKAHTKNRVSLVNIASNSGKERDTLEMNEQVTVHSKIAGWAFISQGAKRGYVPTTQIYTFKPQSIANAKDYLPSCEFIYTYQDVYQGYQTIYDTFSCVATTTTKTLKNVQDASQTMSYELNNTYLEYYASNLGTTYPFPLYEGKSWEDFGISYVQGVNEVLKTPAATFFHVIKIRRVFEGEISYTYLAPGFGVVRIEHALGAWELYNYQ